VDRPAVVLNGVTLPEGLSRRGIGAVMAAPAFFTEQGRFHQQFGQSEHLTQILKRPQTALLHGCELQLVAGLEPLELLEQWLLTDLKALGLGGHQGTPQQAPTPLHAGDPPAASSQSFDSGCE
jgi:hypothetical protein